MLSFLSLLIVIGGAHPTASNSTSDRGPTAAENIAISSANIRGHFYVNVANGEVIATSERGCIFFLESWIADLSDPCAMVAPGHPGRPIHTHDDPNSPDFGIGATYLDWGDIKPDSIIGAIQVSTFAEHPDTDIDGDGVGDGVIGLGCVWTFAEGDNGFNSSDTRQPITEITMLNIPGSLHPDVVDGYQFTIDLADDRSFEIGDTNGISNAAFVNLFGHVNDELDLDADGLVDWSMAIRYIQPGTLTDDQGRPIGDPANRHRTYTEIAAPRGHVEPTGVFVLDEFYSAGREDAFDILRDLDADGTPDHVDTRYFGGFTCDADGDGIFGPGDSRPYASFFTALFERAAAICCSPDIGPDGTCCTGDGVLNFFDVANFIALFNAGDHNADFFPPAGGDGLLNFYDISTYISYFNAGCP